MWHPQIRILQIWSVTMHLIQNDTCIILMLYKYNSRPTSPGSSVLQHYYQVSLDYTITSLMTNYYNSYSCTTKRHNLAVSAWMMRFFLAFAKPVSGRFPWVVAYSLFTTQKGISRCKNELLNAQQVHMAQNNN